MCLSSITVNLLQGCYYIWSRCAQTDTVADEDNLFTSTLYNLKTFCRNWLLLSYFVLFTLAKSLFASQSNTFSSAFLLLWFYSFVKWEYKVCCNVAKRARLRSHATTIKLLLLLLLFWCLFMPYYSPAYRFFSDYIPMFVYCLHFSYYCSNDISRLVLPPGAAHASNSFHGLYCDAHRRLTNSETGTMLE